jgi:hypothetical protein
VFALFDFIVFSVPQNMLSTQDQAVGNEEVDKSVVELPGVYFIIEKAPLVMAYLDKVSTFLFPLSFI